MQTPAGFLSFQGANAVDDGIQTITIKFTNDRTKGMFLDDLDRCEVDVNETMHGFNVTGNCSCNSCKERCPANSDYVPTSALEGFNWQLVSIVWGATLAISIGVTVYRYSRKQIAQRTRNA